MPQALKAGVVGPGAVGFNFGGMLARSGAAVTVLGRPMLDTGAVIHRPEVSVSHDIVVHGEVFGQVVVSKSLRTRLPAMATFLGTGVTIALL